jgi:hypothetical protein
MQILWDLGENDCSCGRCVRKHHPILAFKQAEGCPTNS